MQRLLPLFLALLTLAAGAVPLPRHVRTFFPDLDPEYDEAAQWITGMGTDAAGNVYLVDRENRRVAKVSPAGQVLMQIRNTPYLTGPQDVAVDSEGAIYVTDAQRYKVVKFDAAGNFVREWGQQGPGIQMYAVPANDYDFNYPYRIVCPPDGRVFVSDTQNGRVQVFSGDGFHLGALWIGGSIYAPGVQPQVSQLAMSNGLLSVWESRFGAMIGADQTNGLTSTSLFDRAAPPAPPPGPVDIESLDGVTISAWPDRMQIHRAPTAGSFPTFTAPGLFLAPTALAAVPATRTLYVSDGYQIYVLQWDRPLNVRDPVWSSVPPDILNAPANEKVPVSVGVTGTPPWTVEWWQHPESELPWIPAPPQLIQSGSALTAELTVPADGGSMVYRVVVSGICDKLETYFTLRGVAGESENYPVLLSVAAGIGRHDAPMSPPSEQGILNFPWGRESRSIVWNAQYPIKFSYVDYIPFPYETVYGEWRNLQSRSTADYLRLTAYATGHRIGDDPLTQDNRPIDRSTGLCGALSKMRDRITIAAGSENAPVQLFARTRLEWKSLRPVQPAAKPLVTATRVAVYNSLPVVPVMLSRPTLAETRPPGPVFSLDWQGDKVALTDQPAPAHSRMLDIPLGTFTPGTPGFIALGLWTEVQAQVEGDYESTAALCVTRLFAKSAGGASVPLTGVTAVSGTAYYTGPASAAYDAWRLTQFGSITSAQGAPAADPDNDGANNTAEFFFHMHPLVRDALPLTPGEGTAGLPLIRMEGSAANRRLTIEYIAPAECGAATLEASSDCVNWTGTGPIILATAPVSPGWVRIKAWDPLNTAKAGARRYLRLRVEL